MGCTRRASTTSRPPVPQGLYSEYRRDYLWDIDRKIKRYGNPPELVLTPIIIHICWQINHGSKWINGHSKRRCHKRALTLNSVVTLANNFLLMQVIYSSKTKASQPHDFKFTSGFCYAKSKALVK